MWEVSSCFFLLFLALSIFHLFFVLRLLLFFGSTLYFKFNKNGDDDKNDDDQKPGAGPGSFFNSSSTLIILPIHSKHQTQSRGERIKMYKRHEWIIYWVERSLRCVLSLLSFFSLSSLRAKHIDTIFNICPCFIFFHSLSNSLPITTFFSGDITYMKKYIKVGGHTKQKYVCAHLCTLFSEKKREREKTKFTYAPYTPGFWDRWASSFIPSSLMTMVAESVLGDFFLSFDYYIFIREEYPKKICDMGLWTHGIFFFVSAIILIIMISLDDILSRLESPIRI